MGLYAHAIAGTKMKKKNLSEFVTVSGVPWIENFGHLHVPVLLVKNTDTRPLQYLMITLLLNFVYNIHLLILSLEIPADISDTNRRMLCVILKELCLLIITAPLEDLFYVGNSSENYSVSCNFMNIRNPTLNRQYLNTLPLI